MPEGLTGERHLADLLLHGQCPPVEAGGNRHSDSMRFDAEKAPWGVIRSSSEARPSLR